MKVKPEKLKTIWYCHRCKRKGMMLMSRTYSFLCLDCQIQLKLPSL